jgi:DNA repair exonuclease SbcCD ATPase subunit
LQGKEEEEEEEVKLIYSIFNRTHANPLDVYDEEILPEFEDLLSGDIEYPLPGNKTDDAEKHKVYEIEMANNASELERLQKLVKELEEREVRLEGELLEYYGLKEQESDILEIQRQLKIKTVEIDMLNITINSLQAERKKLQEEIARGVSAKKELEVARNKIKELQRQIQLEANQTKGQLLLLKQQVSGLQAKEEEAVKKDSEIEKKLKAVEELGVEVVELKRKNKELQHEKRELTVKLDAAEARIAALSSMTEVRVTMLFACLYAPVTSASSSLSSSSCFACFLFNWVGAGGARNLSCSFGFYFCDTSTGQIKCWHGSLYE